MEKGHIGMAINKRRSYIIKRAFQLRYIGVILFFILLTAVISSIAIYLAIFPYLSEKLADVYPQGRLLTVLSQANIKALLSVAFVLPVAIWVGIILSNRIAGPWYRLETILREIAEGNLTSEVKLRQGDELQSLADAINVTTANLKAMSQENINYLNSLDEASKAFEEVLNREPLDTMQAKLLLSKMQNIAKELRASLKRHRLE
jgi:methyl-accepting chemotaxis protein